MFEKGRAWEWATRPARRLRWRVSGWSTRHDQAFHDRLFQSADYDPFSESYPGYVTIRRFADHAAARLGGVRHAVDLGCGPGEITCELARRCPDIRFTGIDHSEVALSRARRHAARLGLANATFVRGDLETYAPESGTDLVMMLDAFHHVLDPRRFVARIRDAGPRLFLIEPAGRWTGSWDRRGDLDWLGATLLQVRERLESQFGLDAGTAAAAGRASPAHPEGGPTEHRYTLTDFQHFFDGFGVELRGTIAGLEQYGSRPYDTSPLRAAFGRLSYDTVVGLEDVLFEQGVDLAAKHWAIFAVPGGTTHWPEARLRRAAVHPRPGGGLLPAYALDRAGVTAPTSTARDRTFEARLRLRNTGWQTWDSHASPPVLASYHWADAQGTTVIHDGLRTPLPSTIGPGEDADVIVNVQAPPQPGRYRLLVDLVHEHTTWFSEQGCVIPPADVEVT